MDSYLTVDYERSEFYVSQCAFQQGATEHIITIPSLNSTSVSPTSSHSFPLPAIVGIAVGGIILGVVLVLGLLFFFKIPPFAKSKAKSQTGPTDEVQEMTEYMDKPELDTIPISAKPATEIAGTAVEYYRPDKDGSRELENTGPDMVYEMLGDTPRAQELHAAERSPISQGSPLSGTVSPVSDRGQNRGSI
jgi:hypothetical protein